MAQAGVTLKVMPEGVEVDRAVLKEDVKKVINEVYGDVGEIRESETPIGFGLVAVEFIFIIDEAKGTDDVQAKVEAMETVASAKVVDFRRALG